MREEAIYNRVKAGDGTIGEIVASVYSDIDPRLHAAAGLSTLAHLEHLIEKGRVELRDAEYKTIKPSDRPLTPRPGPACFFLCMPK